MIKYALYTIYSEENFVCEFEDDYQYEVGSKIFYHKDGVKKLFVVNHITHDVFHDGGTLHRLYCQVKKAF